MTVIDGIDVAIYQCESCGGQEMLIFRGQSGEGYKIACADVRCGKDQRALLAELNIPYLWRQKEGNGSPEMLIRLEVKDG